LRKKEKETGHLTRTKREFLERPKGRETLVWNKKARRVENWTGGGGTFYSAGKFTKKPQIRPVREGVNQVTSQGKGLT